MRKLLLAAALVVFATSANAAGLIEPYVGYGLGKFEFKGSGQEADVKGLGAGLRLGYALPMVFFGLEGSYGVPDVEFDSGGGKWDGKQTSFGAFAGVALPIGIRLWGAYHFLNELETESGGTTVKYEGTMYKAGIGFRLIPLLYLNAEYIINDYDEMDGNKLPIDIEHNTIFVSLSVPLSL